MTNFDAVGPFFLRGRELLRGFGFFVCGFAFFPRDTPLTQQAVNCNEWSLIIAPLDPVSLYRKENQKSFWGLWVPLFFFFIERRWWVLWGGVSFWHTMILLLLFVASSTWCWHWWSHWVEWLDHRTALNVITSVSHPCWEPKQGLLQCCTEAALGAQTSSHHHYVVELILVILKAFPTSTVAPALVGQ